ncbi:hypothetical protein KCU86_g1397, partial [Aureobasidium melanogenum]
MLTSPSMANMNDDHYDKMASLTGLPPELRAVIYTYLLEDGLASGKRIVYCNDDGQYDDLEFSSANQHSEDQDDAQSEREVVGWTRSVMQYTKNYQARITFLIDVRYTYGPEVLKRAIHHADIDNLLSLASTCHRIRTEVLPIAWSNVDITVYTPDNHFKDDVFQIFGRCLSKNTCAMINNLHIDVGTSYWSASDVSETSNFIIKHLPHLKDLHVSVAREHTVFLPPDIDSAKWFFGFSMTVIHTQSPTVRTGKVVTLNDMLFFESVRREIQFARALRDQNEERHVDGFLLEDTLGLRSGMAGWPVLASHTNPKERWEVRGEGCWRNGWKVREGVEDAIEDEREYSLGPWSDKMKSRMMSEGTFQDNMN